MVQHRTSVSPAVKKYCRHRTLYPTFQEQRKERIVNENLSWYVLNLEGIWVMLVIPWQCAVGQTCSPVFRWGMPLSPRDLPLTSTVPLPYKHTYIHTYENSSLDTNALFLNNKPSQSIYQSTDMGIIWPPPCELTHSLIGTWKVIYSTYGWAQRHIEENEKKS